MSKTITLRIDENVYNMFKTAADGVKRNLANFIEYATLSYLTENLYASDDEMEEILQDKTLIKNLKQAERNISQGKYKIV